MNYLCRAAHFDSSVLNDAVVFPGWFLWRGGFWPSCAGCTCPTPRGESFSSDVSWQAGTLTFSRRDEFLLQSIKVAQVHLPPPLLLYFLRGHLRPPSSSDRWLKCCDSWVWTGEKWVRPVSDQRAAVWGFLQLSKASQSFAEMWFIVLFLFCVSGSSVCVHTVEKTWKYQITLNIIDVEKWNLNPDVV